MTVRLAASLTAFVLGAFMAPWASAQSDEPVRLRLALDHEGRVHLSTEPVEPAVLPPSLNAAPLPTPGTYHPSLAPMSGIAIDLSASGQELLPAGCLSPAGGLSGIGTFGCDPAGYGGLPGAVQSGDIVIRFDSASAYGFDVSYGLGWLDEGAGTFAHEAGLAGGSILLPGWVGPGLAQPDWRSERVGVGGYLWLGPELRLSLGLDHASGPLAMFQVDPVTGVAGIAGLAASPWLAGGQEDSLSIALGTRRFQGTITGRQLRPDNAGEGLSLDSLDLGFSWRMPWRAALEFGARNLIVKPRKADEARQPAEGDLRVPYVRYHQEL